MSTLTVRKSPSLPQALDKDLEAKFEYPGIPTTCDGAEAVVHVEIQISQAAGAYPITSSTTMGGGYNAAVMNGQKNLWGDPLMFFEPESEHSAATVCEGFAVAGGRVTNFTSGQGLVLMKEVLYTISGKRLPVLMNIGARALTSQGLNVHAGHDDLMSVADCGWGMIFGRNAQEAGDFCLIARRTAEATQTPFFNVQDGFLTTHTVETVRLSESEFMKEYIGDPKEKLINLMDPANPLMSGVVQNQDSYMKGCQTFTVFERMEERMSTKGNHLTSEIKAAFCDAMTGQNGQERIERIPRIYSAAAGLGSRDVRPGDIIASYRNMMTDGQDYF